MQYQNDKKWEVILLDKPNKNYLKAISEFFDTAFPNRYAKSRAGEILINQMSKGNEYEQKNKMVIALAVSSNKVVGIMSATLREITSEGVRARCYVMGNTFTHPDFRTSGSCAMEIGDRYLDRSVFGRLFFELEKRYFEHVDFVYGLPNEEALKAWVKHAGFTEYEGSSLKSFVSYPNIDIFGKFFKRVLKSEIRMETVTWHQFETRLTNYGLASCCGARISPKQVIARFNYAIGLEYKAFILSYGLRQVFVIGKTIRTNKLSVFYVCKILHNKDMSHMKAIGVVLSSFSDFDRIVYLSSSSLIRSCFLLKKFLKQSKVLIVVKNRGNQRVDFLSNFFNNFSYSDTDII
jgi:hypothetical protein